MAFLHGPLPPLHASRAPACPQGPLVLDQLVHVVLGAVLAGGDLENEGNAEQGFLGIPVRNNLQQSRVCQGSAVPVGRCCYLRRGCMGSGTATLHHENICYPLFVGSHRQQHSQFNCTVINCQFNCNLTTQFWGGCTGSGTA